eukprot:s10_g50.t2
MAFRFGLMQKRPKSGARATLLQPGCLQADQRREFGSQVARDVAVWMVLAFATAQTDLGPYLIYAGGFSVAFAVINEMQEQHFLGCDGDLATTLQSPSSWQLLPMINGWSRFYNVQEQKYLSLNDRRDGGFLYCMKEIPNPDILEEAAFFIEAVPKSQRL